MESIRWPEVIKLWKANTAKMPWSVCNHHKNHNRNRYFASYLYFFVPLSCQFDAAFPIEIFAGLIAWLVRILKHHFDFFLFFFSFRKYQRIIESNHFVISHALTSPKCERGISISSSDGQTYTYIDKMINHYYIICAPSMESLDFIRWQRFASKFSKMPL